MSVCSNSWSSSSLSWWTFVVSWTKMSHVPRMREHRKMNAALNGTILCSHTCECEASHSRPNTTNKFLLEYEGLEQICTCVEMIHSYIAANLEEHWSQCLSAQTKVEVDLIKDRYRSFPTPPRPSKRSFFRSFMWPRLFVPRFGPSFRISQVSK